MHAHVAVVAEPMLWALGAVFFLKAKGITISSTSCRSPVFIGRTYKPIPASSATQSFTRSGNSYFEK